MRKPEPKPGTEAHLKARFESAVKDLGYLDSALDKKSDGIGYALPLTKDMYHIFMVGMYYCELERVNPLRRQLEQLMTAVDRVAKQYEIPGLLINIKEAAERVGITWRIAGRR